MSVVTDRHLDDPRLAQSYNHATRCYETWERVGVITVWTITTQPAEDRQRHVPHTTRILPAAGY